MAGKNPQEAVKNFRRPLQLALSCVTNQVWRASPGASQPGRIHGIRVPTNNNDFLPLAGERRLQMSAALEYEVVETDVPGLGPWKVSIRKYEYHVVTEALDEVILYHWHPENSARPAPHMHLGSSQLMPAAVVSSKQHAPTGRVALEEVLAYLIVELGVVPRRPDWTAVLARGRERFRTYCTWT